MLKRDVTCVGNDRKRRAPRDGVHVPGASLEGADTWSSGRMQTDKNDADANLLACDGEARCLLLLFACLVNSLVVVAFGCL